MYMYINEGGGRGYLGIKARYSESQRIDASSLIL